MNRRDFSLATLAAAAASSFAPLARASTPMPPPMEGRQWSMVPKPLMFPSDGKVQVMEFFSFACPHCADAEPQVRIWRKRMAPDVVFTHVPVPFMMNHANFARAYYAYEAMGPEVLDKMMLKTFFAIHVEHNYLAKPEDIAALVTKNGFDGKRFLDAFNSFTVVSKAKRSEQLCSDFDIQSTPALVVGGKYATSPAAVGGFDNATLVADYLIIKSRHA